jgi:hypothetical protein
VIKIVSELIKERLGVIIDVLNEVQHFGNAEVSVQVKVDLVQQVQSCQFTAKLIVFAEFCQQPTVSVIDSEALQSQTIDISVCQAINWHDHVNVRPP